MPTHGIVQSFTAANERLVLGFVVITVDEFYVHKDLFLKSHYLLGKLSMMTSVNLQYSSTVLNLECKHPSNTWPKHEGRTAFNDQYKNNE